jgi:hypothetical protein
VANSNGGELFDDENGGAGFFATGVIGKTMQINTINDVAGATKQYLYIIGALKYTRSSSGFSSFYDKYGCYRNNSGHGPATFQWWNVELFHK